MQDTLHSVVVAPLGWDSFPDSPCFWWPWQFWALLSYFVEYLSLWFCLMCLLISLGLPIGKEDHRGEMQFLQHHIKGTCCRHDSLPMVLITWRRHLVARFLHCRVIFPFPVLYSLGASRVLVHLLEGQYRHELFGIFVMGDLSLPPQLFFNYLFLWLYYLLFIWVWMHFILWIINPKVINFVVYISFCGWITFLKHTPWGAHNWSGCLWGLCY